MYSALKHRGQRLYDLAREGIEVERKPRRVHVRHLEVKAFTPPVLALEVKCGRGLYLRSLAHDIGQSLGCGAHMTALTRFQAGAFLLEASVQLDELERGAAGGGWQAHLLPLDYPLLSMKPLKVPPAAEKLLRNGQPASIGPQFAQTTHLESRRAYGLDGRFLGVLRWDRSQGVWVPDKLFHPGEPSPHAP
jgi:tRNA pseudouridine55 synthase